ncbi:molybdenum ABC transporter ATP-binding protein [Brenneria uluponensis]|uniref:molybdenum ABC transporter ATP-binding protein n=1 Tax=Brenneria uluponensis TaxID=3057057 RepID=UPI0028E6C743|nr:molybdenum ABC transporter ATP-binding protein [Brenneria ulupoensis]
MLPDSGSFDIPVISVRVCVIRPGFTLDVDLQLPGHGITAFFGPSGSGKTTLLRCLAGLERASVAEITVNGVCWQDEFHFMPTRERALGYVFQEASLLPHWSVRGNLAFAQSRAFPSDTRRQALEEMAERFGIDHLLERDPSTLSGGERQRVAIARALLAQPRVLLMDEPLAALDQQRKNEILPYLERLHRELSIPVIYVSHSLDEVLRLADHLVLLSEGRVQASGALQATLANLAWSSRPDMPVQTVIEGRIVAHESADGLSRIGFAGGELWVMQRDLPIGQTVRCGINANDVSLCCELPGASSILNRLKVQVVDMTESHHPAQMLVRLKVGETPLLANITRRSCRLLELCPGQFVWAQIKTVAVLD